MDGIGAAFCECAQLNGPQTIQPTFTQCMNDDESESECQQQRRWRRRRRRRRQRWRRRRRKWNEKRREKNATYTHTITHALVAIPSFCYGQALHCHCGATLTIYTTKHTKMMHCRHLKRREKKETHTESISRFFFVSLAFVERRNDIKSIPHTRNSRFHIQTHTHSLTKTKIIRSIFAEFRSHHRFHHQKYWNENKWGKDDEILGSRYVMRDGKFSTERPYRSLVCVWQCDGGLSGWCARVCVLTVLCDGGGSAAVENMPYKIHAQHFLRNLATGEIIDFFSLPNYYRFGRGWGLTRGLCDTDTALNCYGISQECFDFIYACDDRYTVAHGKSWK